MCRYMADGLIDGNVYKGFQNMFGTIISSYNSSFHSNTSVNDLLD